ncbi:NACHT domain-containing protein [Spirosoma pulveris]
MELPIPDLDDTSKELVKSAASALSKELWKNISGWLNRKTKEYDVFSLGLERYITEVYTKYNYIKIFGMRPFPLKDLYVRAYIREKNTNQLWYSLNYLEKKFDRNQRIRLDERKLLDISEILDKLDKFVLLGHPGAGKTTLLKYITLQNLKPDRKNIKLPIFVSCKDFSDYISTVDLKKIDIKTDKFIKILIDYISIELSSCKFEDSIDFINHKLLQGEFIILFDGFDEVNQENKEIVTKSIINFTNKFNGNKYVISCRIAAFNYDFDRFTSVELAEFMPNQIRKFIDNWFYDNYYTGVTCWEKLQNTPQLHELASLPLLLTLICIYYEEKKDFPKNRAELYNKAIRVLLKGWDDTRRIKRDEIYKNLSVTKKESLFSKIAFETFKKNEIFIKEENLIKLVDKFILGVDYLNKEILDYENNNIINSIEAQHGIWVMRSNGVYSFSHLTIHEYFVAKYIVDNIHEGILKGLVFDYILNDQWREVFLLVASMLSDINSFASYLKEKANTIISRSQPLLSIAKHISQIDEANSFQLKIFILLWYLTLIDCTLAGIGFARNLNRYIQKIKDFDSIMSSESSSIVKLLTIGASELAPDRDANYKLDYTEEQAFKRATYLSSCLEIYISSQEEFSFVTDVSFLTESAKNTCLIIKQLPELNHYLNYFNYCVECMSLRDEPEVYNDFFYSLFRCEVIE